ncbi:MAG TPA: hypothetical protein PKD55_13490 [Bellilinea sp.]|nr:hypothetical protein [Bellilinea sp.]
MADEKAAVFQTVQIGVESTPGVKVPANRKLVAVSLTPGARTEDAPFSPSGSKYNYFSTLLKAWGEFGISGQMTYNEIVYLLQCLLAGAAPVQQGATTAYKWGFTSNTTAADTVKTLTIEQGDADSAWRMSGARVSGVTFDFSRNGVTINGSGIGGQLMVEEAGGGAIVMTPSPTSVDPKPLNPIDLKFYMADTQAGLASATAMTRGFSMQWSLTNKFGLAWPVGSDAFAVEGKPNYSGRLRVSTDAYGMAIMKALYNGAKKWFRIEAIGETIADTYKHKFTLDFPAQIQSASDPTADENVLKIEYGLLPLHDTTWGKAMQIDVITNLAAL